ncbi:RDD family protein [Streptomyces sp. NPDC006450]|uniref:RDD family protein n=1 Tax=Streptomyces sp. NPDC006450 TaxID=3155458 RepID=UPI0033B3FC5C
MTASPGDGEHAAREGYYPDPSIPGYVRFWNGLNWVPGTSRPAAPADETGPVFLDQTGVSEALREPERWPKPAPEPAPRPAPRPAPDPWPEPAASRAETESWREPAPRREPDAWPEPAPRAGSGSEPASRAEPGPRGESGADSEPAGWQVDPLHQAGFGGPRDRRVSWGHEEAEAARPGGISLARPPVPAPAPRPEPAPAPAPARVSAPLPAQAAASAAPGGLGILSAPSPVPAPAPVPVAAPAPAPAPVWPAAPGSPGSDPEPVERVRSAQRPAPAPAAAAEPARRVTPVEPAEREERAEGAVPPAPGPARTGRAVFERMAERAVRPAGLVRRATARLLDSLVYAAVATGAALPLVPAATAHIQAKVDAARALGRTTTVWLLDGTVAGSLGLVVGAVLLFGVFYEALPTARWGRTPGKKLLGVRVLATATLRPPRFGAALRRWLLYALLGLPGALWALADRRRRRTLHDRAAGTYVAR